MTAADDARLRHMRDAARAVLQFMTGRERADLDTDIMLAFAVTRGLEIVGEAAKMFRPNSKPRIPTFPGGKSDAPAICTRMAISCWT